MTFMYINSSFKINFVEVEISILNLNGFKKL